MTFSAKSFVVAASAALILGAATSASAAITLEPGELGGPNGVHSTPGLNTSPVTGTINGTEGVTLSTTGDTLKTSGGGLSKFEGGDGAFDDLLITFDEVYGSVGFNLNPLNKVPTTFNLLVNNVTLFSDYAVGNGETKFILKATGTDSISSLQFTFFNPEEEVNLGIADIRQIRTLDVVSAIPEPATWGMMIVGFAGIGSMLRRARRKDGVSTAAA